jgi:hypothetical protein
MLAVVAVDQKVAVVDQAVQAVVELALLEVHIQ